MFLLPCWSTGLVCSAWLRRNTPPAMAAAPEEKVTSIAAREQANSVAAWIESFDNSLMRDLRAEPADRDPYESREVKGAHYTRLRPTVGAPAKALVVYSAAVASLLGLDPAVCEDEEFLRFFSGAPPEQVECWATVYGASFTGRYGGQRGDGRAISVGQVCGKEIQLKGAGITPFSRRSDGRAVLRSSVREFLAQENMAALRVPTTRSLCLIATGEGVRRYWYDDDGREVLNVEPGAVGTRVATSFVRFGQLEIFAQRGEIDLLRELTTHALEREYPHLCEGAAGSDPSTKVLLSMFDEICRRQAHLVAEWMRVVRQPQSHLSLPHPPTDTCRFPSLTQLTSTRVLAASGLLPGQYEQRCAASGIRTQKVTFAPTSTTQLCVMPPCWPILLAPLAVRTPIPPATELSDRRRHP